MRVVVDYPTFVAYNFATQVFYTLVNNIFIACYLRNGVVMMVVEQTIPATFALDFATAISVISMTIDE